MRHDRLDEAKASLMRLTKRPAINCNAQETMAMMKHTNEIEKYLSNDRLSYTRCFTGTNLRRTEIACVVCVTQAFSGGAVGGYAAYFNEQVGLSASNSFNLVIAMYGAGILGNIVCWFLLPFIGRRRLYISGLIVLLVTLILIGIVDLLVTSTARPWVLGSLLILLTSVYDLTIGPVCYVLVAEIPSTRLRLKTVVLARVAYNLSLLFVSTVTPKMLNPTAWNWKGKACFFFAGTNFLCLVWTYWRLPELFGLSYLEIDLLFEKKARTGKFRELQVKLENAGYFSLARNGQEPSIWVGF